MLEVQIKCLTCNAPINNQLRRYEYYKKVLGLSRTDAVDKAQFTKMCCRTTAFSQSGVEERMYAAGRVETKGNIKSVYEISDYPIATPVRTQGEGPFARDDVKEAPRVNEKMSFRSYGGLNPGIKKIPSPTVVTFSSVGNEKTPFTRINKTNLISDLHLYPNKNWTLGDTTTFPRPEEYEEPFNSRDVTFHLKIPFVEDQNVEIKILERLSLRKALELLRDEVMAPRIGLFSLAIKSNALLKNSLILDVLLANERDQKSTSLFELSGGSLVVKKVSYSRNTKVDTIEFEPYRRKLTAKESKTETDLLAAVKNKTITSIELTDKNVILSLAKTILTFDTFELRTASSKSVQQNDIPIGASIVGANSSIGGLLITLKLNNWIGILAITGHFDLKADGVDVASVMVDKVQYEKVFTEEFGF